MPSLSKFHCFTLDVLNGLHDFDNDTFKIALTNATPDEAAWEELLDASEIAAGNGYPAGGLLCTVTTSSTSGVARAFLDDITLTASGDIPAFRYGVLYNDSTVGDRLVGWFAYSESITMHAPETFVFDFNPVLGVFTFT